jgi:hypothetical protein
MITFEVVWRRIQQHEEETFRQIRGKEFTYSLGGQYITLNATNQNIPKKHLEEAFSLVPLKNTVPVQHLRGPSYIYAVLMDRRIRQTDW